MSNKTNEEKGVINDIKGAFAVLESRIENNGLYKKFKSNILVQNFFKRLAYAQVRPKRRYVYQIDKEGKQWAETTFNLKHDGSAEFAGTRFISQAEAQKIDETNRKIGRKVERHENGKITLDNKELSAEEVEFFKRIKQHRENKDINENVLGNTINSKNFSNQKLELTKAAAVQSTPRNTIFSSIQRIKATTSALSGKNTKIQQIKNAKSL
ncbi:MAG: hypothetical protein FWC30_02280 [Candidatus Bathyarchaeota archaeon]|jgi:hypothetical protein|nr:hypothetical protein [Candidatus Termiticorpusculum sp.]